MVTYDQFLISVNYFKAFHLSDTQLKRIFNHYADPKLKTLDYMKLTQEVAGPPNKNKHKLAKEILSNLATKSSKY